MNSKLSKKLNLKGSIQISMSWIFMILIGTFFIILAYNIIGKYHEIENEKYQIELKNVLREILNNAGRTTGIEESSLQPIGNVFKDSRVEILCEDLIPILSINDRLSTENQFIKDYPIFMTYIEQEKIDSTYIAIESFRMPFKITTMLALISKKNLIVLDKESEITEELLFKFNKGSFRDLNYIVREFSTLDSNFIDEIERKNYNSVMFVSDAGKIPSGINLNEIRSKAYFLEINKENDYYGSLRYTDKKGENYEFNYIDFNKKLSLPTMAIFSNPNTFTCSYNLIEKEIEPIYSFYIEKSKYLEEISKYNKLCSDSVNTDAEYTFYQTLKNNLIETLEYFKGNGFSEPNNLLTKLHGIENSQIELEKFSCNYVY